MIGDRIRIARKKLKFTQTKFAKEIGISPNYLSEIEANKKSPSERILKLMEVRFAINKDWLLTGEGEMFRKKDGNTQIAEGDGINQIIGSNNRNSININVNKKAFAQNLDSIVPNKEAIEVINLIIEGHYTPNIISDCLKKLRKIKEATESDE